MTSRSVNVPCARAEHLLMVSDVYLRLSFGYSVLFYLVWALPLSVSQILNYVLACITRKPALGNLEPSNVCFFFT